MSNPNDAAIPLPRVWAADRAPLGIVALGRRGHVLYVNAAAARILGGTSTEQVLGRDARDFHDVPELAWAAAHDHREGAHVRELELTLRRLDGTPVEVRIHADLLDDGPAGIAAVATLEDVGHARARAEGASRGRTMAAVGRLAGGVAHHFNNLLASILANVSLLDDVVRTGDGLDPGTAAEELAQIAASARRASEIADLLLVVSGRELGERVALDASSWIYAAAGRLRGRLPGDVELVVQAEGRDLRFRASEERLAQALDQLVRNAEEALNAGGRIALDAGELTLTGRAGEPAFTPPALPGAYVRISVEDDGLGMNADTRARALEPFFSTRRDREGAGLGLALVYGIVVQMGGHLLVESQPVLGTRVVLIFPAEGATDDSEAGTGARHLLEAVRSPAPASTRDGPPAPDAGADVRPLPDSGTPSLPAAGSVLDADSLPIPDSAPVPYDLVLVADDDEAVRNVMRKILVRAGYRVVTAVNGRDAQRVFLEHRDELALVVTDIMMPELNGVELGRWAREQIPDLPVLLVSGFAESPLAQDWIDHQPDGFLGKPFEPADFLAWIGRHVPVSLS